MTASSPSPVLLPGAASQARVTSEIVLPRARPKAREVVIAPVLPPRPREYRGMFASDGDMVAECDLCAATPGARRWHALGPRADVQKALAEHRRMYHAQADGEIVFLINRPRQ